MEEYMMGWGRRRYSYLSKMVDVRKGHLVGALDFCLNIDYQGTMRNYWVECLL